MGKKIILILLMVIPSLVIGQNVKFSGFTKSQLTNSKSVPGVPQQKTQPEKEKPEIVSSVNKNVGKAMLLSVLFPGTGEYYLGHKTMGKFLMGVDVSLWGTHWGSRHLENTKERDYKNLARQHAEVGDGKYDDYYWIQVGNHMDIYANNKQELIERNIDKIYTDIDTYSWNWDSKNNLIRYNQMRIDANNLRKLSDKMVMGLFINRLISVVNVIRINKMNKKDTLKKYSVNWKFDYNYSQRHGDYLGVSLVKAF